MKGTMDETGTDGGSRRGLFRLGRRSTEPADQHAAAAGSTDTVDAQDAVAVVDDLARRMDELLDPATTTPHEQDPVRAEFDMQRALIARANDMAAATADSDATDTHMPTEAPVQQQPTSAQDQHDLDHDDIEARLDAALQPIPTPAHASDSVTLEPTPELEADEPAYQQDAVLSPTVPSSGASAASSIGIDIERMVRIVEDEARGVQHRIELEMRTARARAEEILDRAEAEAEKIREHGQAQARVLLGEVEEIISEAQQTGEQILLRANEEASTVRSESANVMQQAQAEARAIVETARREGEQVLAEQRRLATVRAQEAMREQDRLKDQIRRLEERRRQVLESLEPLISQLTQMMPAGTQQGSSAPQNVVHLQRPQQPAGSKG